MQVNGEWSFSGQSHYSLSCSARLPPLPDSAFGRVDSSAQPNVQPISSNTDSDPHFERPPASSQDVRSSALWPASNLSADSSALTADQRLERLQIRKQMKSHCPPRSIRIISPYAHASPLGSTAHSFAPLSSSAASSSDSVKTNRLANTSQPLSQIDVSNDNPVQSVRTSISILPNAQRRSNRHSSSRSASGAPETEDEEFDDDQDDEKRPIRSLPITEHSINSFALSFQCTASPSPSSDSCSPGEPSLPIASTCTFTSPTSTSFASGVLYPMAAGSPSQSIGRHRPNEPSDGGGLLPPSSAIVTPTSHHHRAASSIHSSHADVPPSSASIAFDSQRVKSNSIDHQSRSLPSPPITLTSHSQTSSPLHTVYHLPASASNPIRSDRPFLSPGEPVVDRLHVIERDPNAANRPNEIVATSGVEADDEHEALDRARRVHRLPPNHLHQYHHSYHYQKRRPRLRSPHRPYSIVGSGAAIRPTSPYCARIDSESDHSSENDRDFSARSIGRSGTNSLHATSRTTICTIAQPEHRPIACQPESVHLNDKLDSELRFAGRLRKCTLQIKNCIFKSNAARHERSTNTAPNVDSALVTLKQQLDARPVHRYGAGLLVTLHVLLELLRDRIHRSRWCFIMSTDCVEDDPSSSACDTATAPRWRHRCRRVGQWMKKFVAHLFSTSGLCLLTVGYCIMGAAIFERLERQHNLNEIRSMTNYRNETVYHLWSLTKLSNVLKEDEWTMNASRFLEQFEKEIIKKVETAGYSGNVTDKWDFSDSLLYSITVVTTIGYGHISPKTNWGRFVTILYAVFGIPIMLLCITNLGHLMANTFRFGYQSICCYPCNRLEQKTQQNQLKLLQKEINERKNSQAGVNRLAVASDQPSVASSIADAAKSTSENVYQEVGSRSPNTSLIPPVVSGTSRKSLVQFEASELIVRLKDNQLVIEKATQDVEKHHRVPIRLVLLIVIGYLCLGGLLFSAWESDGKSEMDHNDFFKWTYFCFITLSTIGFGDIVPGNSIRLRQNQEGSAQILFCCLYLVFGLALIAMSFNLVQEEVIFKMKRMCRRFGVYFQKA